MGGSHGKIRFGILGTSEVAPRSLIEPLRRSGRAEVYGIASRCQDRADKYALRHNIPCAFSGYQALLDHPEIDVVYIPLINSIHAEWIVKAAEQRKHVLVEKPICIESAAIYDIERAACTNSVHILEGMMIQYSPWQERLKQIVDQCTYGSFKSIKTQATYKLEPTDTFRVHPEKGGGVFYEEGLLWCEITQLCCGLEPVQISGKSDFAGPNGIDATFEAKMSFRDGTTSELLCSYELPYMANHWIDFEDAQITIRNFWKPCFGTFRISFDVLNKRTKQAEKILFEPENYYMNQIGFILDAMEGKRSMIPLGRSFERVKMMERIYRNAKANKRATSSASI